MKKFVLRLELMEDQDKRRALKTVSALSGIDEITMDMKGKKLTVVGTVDPVSVVSKLRKKNWTADIISVGPAKEEPKKEEEPPKKEEAKKDEAKKEEGEAEEVKKEEEKKKVEEEATDKKEEAEEGKKKSEKEGNNVIKVAEPPQFVYGAMPYRPYYYPPPPPPMNANHYYVRHHSVEENPNACVIF